MSMAQMSVQWWNFNQLNRHMSEILETLLENLNNIIAIVNSSTHIGEFSAGNSYTYLFPSPPPPSPFKISTARTVLKVSSCSYSLRSSFEKTPGHLQYTCRPVQIHIIKLIKLIGNDKFINDYFKWTTYKFIRGQWLTYNFGSVEWNTFAWILQKTNQFLISSDSNWMWLWGHSNITWTICRNYQSNPFIVHRAYVDYVSIINEVTYRLPHIFPPSLPPHPSPLSLFVKSPLQHPPIAANCRTHCAITT